MLSCTDLHKLVKWKSDIQILCCIRITYSTNNFSLNKPFYNIFAEVNFCYSVVGVVLYYSKLIDVLYDAFICDINKIIDLSQNTILADDQKFTCIFLRNCWFVTCIFYCNPTIKHFSQINIKPYDKKWILSDWKPTECILLCNDKLKYFFIHIQMLRHLSLQNVFSIKLKFYQK